MYAGSHSRAALVVSATVMMACHGNSGMSRAATRADADSVRAGAARVEAARLTQYNRGTRALGTLKQIQKDTISATNRGLTAAVGQLDSATVSRTKNVRQSALFNAGWTRMILAMRLMKLLPTPKDSALRDTAIRTASGASQRASLGLPATMAQNGSTSDSTSSDSAMSPSAKAKLVQQQTNDSLMSYATIALAQYRAYLTANPNDADARWNYELLLVRRKMMKPKKKGVVWGNKGKPMKPKIRPPVKQFHLPPKEAQQLLQAASQREEAASAVKPTPTMTPPEGNDW